MESRRMRGRRFECNLMTPRNPPSCIRLHDENGLRLTLRIKKVHPGIRIAIVTGHYFPECRHTAAQYGADWLFVKDAMNCHEVAAFID